jgi:hypothetical protein
MNEQLAVGAGVGLAVGLSGAAFLLAAGALMQPQGRGASTYEVRRDDAGRIMGVEQHQLDGGNFPALPA